ncbi:DUF3011 domain-containing protein [Sandarakinorhabdus rubra]|uniref:DUF3011 domain-containing protein n=1 Tax=Sandarakinorhabdus rubra TaxID=2672568 RepID=UPI0013DD32DC|nr:DUF3011 domain-containing protein [Sandarakinorhabdus rubra]
MRLLSFTAAASLVSAGLAVTIPAAPAAAQQWREVRCESWNYREASCPVPGAVRVQLLRVEGGSCIEGQTWYHDGNAIRVRGGCRATFRTDSNNGWGAGGWDPNQGGNWGGGAQVQSIRCESWNYRDARCPVNGTIRSVRLTRVIAGDCRDGQTFRWNRNAVLVRNGCRADFEVLLGAAGWAGGGYPGGGSGGNWQGGGNRPITLTCESWNYRAATCVAPRGRQVRLLRVIAGDCRQGRTWGVRPGAVWVNGGCRAEFELY